MFQGTRSEACRSSACANTMAQFFHLTVQEGKELRDVQRFTKMSPYAVVEVLGQELKTNTLASAGVQAGGGHGANVGRNGSCGGSTHSVTVCAGRLAPTLHGDCDR